MNLTQAEHLVLGIIAERPMHAYEIEKLISERGIRKWADIGFSSIYYVLDKVAIKGLADAGDAVGESRRQFTISSAGICALKTGAVELIMERRPANAHLMTGLAISDQIGIGRFVEALHHRHALLSSDLATIHPLIRNHQSLPPSARRVVQP